MSPIKPVPEEGLFSRELGQEERTAERMLDLAARIGRMIEVLPDTRMARHLAAQLVRSATFPGAHFEEALAAENRADYIHRIGLSQKELRETCYWLRLVVRSELMPEARVIMLIDECRDLLTALTQAIAVAKDRATKGKPLK